MDSVCGGAVIYFIKGKKKKKNYGYKEVSCGVMFMYCFDICCRASWKYAEQQNAGANHMSA